MHAISIGCIRFTLLSCIIGLFVANRLCVQFTEMESRVLHRLNFEASSVTVVHFVTEYLADIGIVREDLVSLAYVRAQERHVFQVP